MKRNGTELPGGQDREPPRMQGDWRKLRSQDRENISLGRAICKWLVGDYRPSSRATYCRPVWHSMLALRRLCSLRLRVFRFAPFVVLLDFATIRNRDRLL